ncbi:MAG: DUF6602 domain-containing protein [Tannerella sp.]|jgi:hypothetical protein|uniref:DUF6602 domain-containing protein n=1 Tax=Tannerella sp. TaxID=2382127 RepID=UPI003FA2C85C
MNEEIFQNIKDNYKRLERSIVEQFFLEFPNHKPTTGSYREDIWRSLFRQIVPYKFAIEKGVFVIDSEGNKSKEIDLAIFDEQYTPYIFNYGNVRFIPIEAVAVVVQCKSNNIDNRILKDWSDQISSLKTSTKAIARVISEVVQGYLDPQQKVGQISRKFTQTATRPIRILCYLNNGESTYAKPNEDNFDILICANYENKDKPRIDVKYSKSWNLGEWYCSLNHANRELYGFKKEYSNSESLDDKYRVKDNPLLSLIFQLNQLLMLINNPMLFPHQAYVDRFNKVDS